MVGFLSLEGNRGFDYAIPQAIGWQLACIPGISRFDAASVNHCVQLDRLKLPSDLSKTAAYSRLAAEIGTDFVVAGRITRQDKSRISFSIAVFSAADPKFRKEHVHQCPLSDLMQEAAAAAKQIAADVGHPASAGIRFDSHKVSPKAMLVFDQSQSLFADMEADLSAYRHKSERLANRASALCPSSPMLSDWSLAWADSNAATLKAFRKLRSECPNNLVIIGRIADLYCYLDRKQEAKKHAREWMKLDPTSPAAQIIAGGSTRTPATTWQMNMDAASSYEVLDDIRPCRLLLDKALRQRPNSAYAHYRAGGILGRADDDASAIAEYETALKINPSSYRLRMRLVWAYWYVSRNSDASDALQPALKQWPNRAEPHYYAAKLYRARNEHSAAAREMKIVQRLDPYTDVSDSLAQDYARSGNVLGSLRQMSKTKPGFREAIAVVAAVLTGVFLLGIVGVSVLVRGLLNRDRKPQS